jgi:uncharacterized membrane protein
MACWLSSLTWRSSFFNVAIVVLTINIVAGLIESA